MGLRGLILDLRGLILGLRGLIWGLRKTSEGDVHTDGHLEIHPCVLQDIGPLGLLPKKDASIGPLVALFLLSLPPLPFIGNQLRRGR